MTPFQIPRWRKALINKKYRRKESIVSKTILEIDSAILQSIDYVFEHFAQTGLFAEPSLNSLFSITDGFYRHVVEQAFYDAQDQKKAQGGRKRLAKGPTGVPNDLRSLEQIFRDRKNWLRVMKRSKRLTERMRRQYVQKLRRKFNELTPKILSGEISPADAKARIVKDWEATKPRVETIFRTETTNYFGRTQVAFFNKDPDIIGFLFDSVRDTARTEICRSRHGLIYRPGTKELKENTPSLHYSCRSHLIPLANTPANRKMIEDPQRDPAKKSVAPLPRGWRK